MHSNFVYLLLSFAVFRFTNSSHSQYNQYLTTVATDLTTEETDSTLIPDYEDVNAKPKKKQILDTVLHENNYDPTIRPPGVNGSGPVEVKIGVYLRSIGNVDDIKMQYSVQMTLWQEWVDSRLKYEHIQSNIKYLQLVTSQKVWMPDIFFRNEKSGYLHELMVPNLYTRLFPDGKILQSYRVSMVLSCPMNLKAYPLDVQACPISMVSYGWTVRDLLLSWSNDTPIKLASEFTTPRFRLKEFYNTICTNIVPTGTYSCLLLQIKFAREFGFYLIQIYFPCSMLVIVSWVSFWLEPTAVEARVSLGVTTILTIVTQTYGINQSAPPASYAKALDVWTAFCMGMVFAALLEFASVNYVCHVQWVKVKRQLAEQKKDKEEIQNEEAKLLSQSLIKGKRIDRISRIVFPIIFTTFNAVYWYYYLVQNYESSTQSN
ncbi:unnamed protein product [Orchesella dallaii]|uniref:Glutamate-gated chloride channel n=1 Tax=Orchesella dallaii TaxID=48710 RepID=A0ABP1RFS8_9HEXA